MLAGTTLQWNEATEASLKELENICVATTGWVLFFTDTNDTFLKPTSVLASVSMMPKGIVSFAILLGDISCVA
jgi:hypothetical protein